MRNPRVGREWQSSVPTTRGKPNHNPKGIRLASSFKAETLWQTVDKEKPRSFRRCWENPGPGEVLQVPLTLLALGTGSGGSGIFLPAPGPRIWGLPLRGSLHSLSREERGRDARTSPRTPQQSPLRVSRGHPVPEHSLTVQHLHPHPPRPSAQLPRPPLRHDAGAQRGSRRPPGPAPGCAPIRGGREPGGGARRAQLQLRRPSARSGRSERPGPSAGGAGLEQSRSGGCPGGCGCLPGPACREGGSPASAARRWRGPRLRPWRPPATWGPPC